MLYYIYTNWLSAILFSNYRATTEQPQIDVWLNTWLSYSNKLKKKLCICVKEPAQAKTLNFQKRSKFV